MTLFVCFFVIFYEVDFVDTILVWLGKKMNYDYQSVKQYLFDSNVIVVSILKYFRYFIQYFMYIFYA